MRHYTFVRDGNTVNTPGISWGYGNPPLQVICEHNNRQVWYKPTTMALDDSGRITLVTAMYVLVQVDGNTATVLVECKPGHYWHNARKTLETLCRDTTGDGSAMALLQAQPYSVYVMEGVWE